MRRRILSILIIVLILSSFCVSSFAYEKVTLQKDANVEYYREMLYNLGVFNLYKDELLFGEETNVTRGEAAKAASDLLGISSVASAEGITELFVDIPVVSEYAKYINTVVRNGIMNGNGTDMFYPDDTISVEQFTKVMIELLGYGWKARHMGGYPQGYNAIAYQLKLLNGVNATSTAPLTKGDLIQIIYNSLDVPIYEISSIGQFVEMKTNEDMTILSEYHNIYTDDAVVNANDITSLKSFYEPQEGKILLGDTVVEIGEQTNVLEYLGCEITYYCKYDDSSDKYRLLYYDLSPRSVFYRFSSNEVEYRNEKILFYDENDRERSIGVDFNNAEIVYNGCIAESNVNSSLVGFTGELVVCDNDGNGKADVLQIWDYEYDIVDAVNAVDGKIYCRSHIIDAQSSEYVKVHEGNGKLLAIDDIDKNNIIGIAQSVNNDVVYIELCRAFRQGNVNMLNLDSSPATIEIADGEEIPLSLGLPSTSKSLISLNSNLCFYLNNFGEIVWVTKMNIDGYSLGYLIECESYKKGLSTEGYVRMLCFDGEVRWYFLGEKVKVNQNRIKLEETPGKLSELKNSLNLASDGKVSQVVLYKVNEDTITDIVTCGNGQLYAKCNSEGNEIQLRRQGYGQALLDGKYLLNRDVPIFRVPNIGQEDSEDDYFSVRYWSESTMPNDSYQIETYIDSEDGIVPIVAVHYTVSTAAETIDENAMCFLVEDKRMVLTENDDYVESLSGAHRTGKCSYQVDRDLDISDVSEGDVIRVLTDPLGRIINYEKLYDYSSDVLNTELAGSKLGDPIYARFGHVVNMPVGSSAFECCLGACDGSVHTNSDLMLANLIPLEKQSWQPMLFKDSGRFSEVSLGLPEPVITCKNSPTECSKVLFVYIDGYIRDVIFYQ